MSCDQVRELFSDHLDGALSVEVEDRLGRHLGGCPSCREALARYEAGVGALAGTSPEPSPGFGPGLTRRLGSEGLLKRPPGAGAYPWLSIAAALVFLGLGLVVGRATGPGGGGPSAPDWADGCAGTAPAVPALDPRAWRTAAASDEPDLALPTGPHVLHLPRRLTSHGPYVAGASPSPAPEGSTCLPLSTPLGAGLTLSLRPGASGEAVEGDRFVVEVDPRRVLYGRVVWQQDGLTWSLEGRAETGELLDVAREIRARARVERGGRRM